MLEDKPKLKLLDLFSGIIGGFSLGLERTGGFETVAFCEIEDFPRRVLAKHWPKVPCYEDVRKLTGEQLAADGITVDAICGGFPCQDISAAGKRAGIDGERSGLWSEYFRLIGELRPSVVFVENVSDLLRRGAGRVFGDLASIGYDCEWHCIQASSVGLPHIRDRAWITAYPATERAELRLQRLPSSEPTRQFGGGFGRAGVRWANKSEIAGKYDGLPNWLDQHCAYGNAVVPQIPELLGNAYLSAMGEA